MVDAVKSQDKAHEVIYLFIFHNIYENIQAEVKGDWGHILRPNLVIIGKAFLSNLGGIPVTSDHVCSSSSFLIFINRLFAQENVILSG